jgi:hypothetical protein
MSDRARELAGRSAALRLRCAVQRRALASEVKSGEARLEGVDRAMSVARGVLLHPAAVVAGVAALIAIGRARGAGVLRLVSRGLLLAAAARRLIRLAKKL